MQARNRVVKFGFLLVTLLLIGGGCPRSDNGSYASPQQKWSDLSDEDRAAVRRVLTAFSDVKDKKPDEIRAIQPLTINVMQRGADILPFPEEQFTIVTPVECPDDCTGDHYVGSQALTLDLRKLSEPSASCEWGVQASATQMDVDNEAFIKWLEEYSKTKR